MKILFTADWHIKLGQKNVPREWQTNRFIQFFNKLNDLQSEADILIIGGDIFDRMPTLEELELFFKFVPIPNIPTYIYDGNHEATKKGHTFFSRLKDITEALNSNIKVLDEVTYLDGIDVIPYCRLKDLKKIEAKANLLCTHVRGEIPPHVKPEVDLVLFDKWDIVLAGDLHSHSNTQRNIIYPGSPLTTSFHRSKVDTGVVILDTDNSSYQFIKLELPQLIRKKVASMDEAIPTEFDHTIYEIEGSVMDLAGVDTSSDIIDKKLVHKDTSAALDLNQKSLTEELQEYLDKIQKLSKEDIVDILNVYHEYVEIDDYI